MVIFLMEINVTCDVILVITKNMYIHYTLRKKGTKAVTGVVPFQKVHFCTQRLHIGTLVVHIST